MSDEIIIGGYTYQDLVDLAKSDVKEYDSVVKELKNKEIERMCVGNPDKERRLKGLQFTIDAKMNKIKNPLVRAQMMQTMMMEEGLYRLRDALDGVSNNEDIQRVTGKQSTSEESSTLSDSKIIPFKPSNK